MFVGAWHAVKEFSGQICREILHTTETVTLTPPFPRINTIKVVDFGLIIVGLAKFSFSVNAIPIKLEKEVIVLVVGLLT